MKAVFGGMPDSFSVSKAESEGFAGSLHIGKDHLGGESTEYYNPAMGVDKRAMIKEHIAKVSIDTQTGGAGTPGTALVPVYVDPSIVDRTIKEAPLRAMLPRRAVKGLTYDYVPLTAKGGAVWAFENGSINEQTDTYDRVSVGIKFLYAKGRVSGPAIAAMRGFIDPTQLDLSVKTASIIEAEEDMIINGDNSTNPEEPDGLIQTIGTNTTDLSSAYPTLSGIRAELATTYNANGMVSVAVTDASTHNYVKGLLLDIQRNVENPSMANMGFGIPGAFDFDGVMFVRDKFMPTSSGSRRILFLDMRYLFMAVLQDLTYEEKPDSADSATYWLKEYIAFVNTFEGASSQIYGIL